jgi:D-glycero-D-manno-heptose 1,7-bisphosphate phosphatase
VFLDRDGVLVKTNVINGVPRPVLDEHAVELADYASEACEELHSTGLPLVVVTNQPDVRRSKVTMETVDRVNSWLARELPVEAIYVCPHDDRDVCACRKPAPGMLVAAAFDLGLDLPRSVMVGDRWRDIDAGHRAGTKAVYIASTYLERRPTDADLVVASLRDAVEWIIAALTADTPTGS